ncbi:hypothetical protein BKA70DRAFT_1282460, partial [Coprinopsis sp. MPI-PUGE-AT-0042]
MIMLVVVVLLIPLYEIDCFAHDVQTTRRPNQRNRSADNLCVWPKILGDISACACFRLLSSSRKDSRRQVVGE